jgi:hypothetical protein
MVEDLKDNKHLYVFSTEEGFGETGITPQNRRENPMLADSGYKDVNGKKLLLNDLFRFVHDAFGHGKLGNSFGPVGEENAWYVHSQMFSPDARRAMTSETRGQNSWVNFGPQLRNKDGSLPKKGDKNYVPLSQRDEISHLKRTSYSQTNTCSTDLILKEDSRAGIRRLR